MTIKLKKGYSRSAISDNIATIMKDGVAKENAVAIALNLARQSYFDRYPTGSLPVELAYPRTRRAAKYYYSDGSPATRGRNPVKELDISENELNNIRKKVKKDFHGQGAEIRKAAALYTDFTGHEDVDLTKVVIPNPPKVGIGIGTVDGLLYTTVRDGVTEKYIHKFKASARPLFVVSHDGKQLYLIGGSYTFTDRGIVDKT